MSVAATPPRTSTRRSTFMPRNTRSSNRSNGVRTGVGAMSTKSSSILLEWPPLTYSEWDKTLDTVHMWTQIVGKTRMALEPLVNHWWNVVLYVTPTGLTTSPMPYRGKTFEVEFDFLSHRLCLRDNSGGLHSIRLY